MAERDWNKWTVGILKAELKRRSLSYRDLAEKMEALGIHDSERNITNKINRGTFTAAFFLQCLAAIGCKTLRLED
jgi:3-mercaptopyruvate sulfurtransferase SseA